jgi:hypothetical protein
MIEVDFHEKLNLEHTTRKDGKEEEGQERNEAMVLVSC